MFAGHFAVATGAVAYGHRLPIWVAMVATQLLDLAFVPFSLLGLESFVPLDDGGYGDRIVRAYFSHSLVGALLLSFAVLLCTWKVWGRHNGLLLAALTFSHWLLDLVVHRPGLPLLPGNWGDLPLMGFSLWQYPTISASVELLMVTGCTLLYAGSLRKKLPQEVGSTWFKTSLMGTFLLTALVIDWLGYAG